MMNFRELVDFDRSLREQLVLSVYVDRSADNPAERHKVALELRHALDEIAKRLDEESREDRERFARCRSLAESEVAALESSMEAAGPGWVGFFTADGPVRSERLPTSVPTIAVWEHGAYVAPYVRSTKASRPVFLAICDARSVRTFKFADRALEHLDDLAADVDVDAGDHMGAPPRAGFHTGTRGSTGADEAQRELRDGTNRMLAGAAGRLAKLAPNDEWVVIGGIDVVAKALRDRLPSALASRTTIGALDVHATTTQIEGVARASASALRNAEDLARVNAAIDGAEANTKGAAGPTDTASALEERRVRELFITTSFVREYTGDAHAAIQQAFDSGATVEHVAGEAAERLDEVGGIAAKLWYAVATAAV